LTSEEEEDELDENATAFVQPEPESFFSDEQLEAIRQQAQAAQEQELALEQE